MMFKKKLSVLLIMVCVLNSIFFMVPGHAATVRHVGPGQTYNGTTSAVIQQAVNAASSGDTIYIHAATYTVSDSIVLKSGLIVKGDGIDKTIIYGPSNVCTTYEKDAYMQCKNISNVEIYGITFKSACANSNEGGDGDKYRNCITARDSSYITVHDCSAPKWLYLDFFKASNSTDLTMYNCNVVTGHAGGYFYKCKRVKAYNNRILVYVNAGLRGDGTTDSEYYNNTIWCEAYSGQAGFEFQNACGGTNMHHNLVYDFTKSFSGHYVTQNAGGVSGTVTFSNNVYWNCSGGVQVGTGTGNKANPTNHDVSYWEDQGYGCGTGGSAPPPDPDAWYSGTNFSSQQNLGTGNTGTAVTIEFDLTPLYSNTSGVVGYADSSTTLDSFSDMAMILSMDTDHYFYARNGGSYAKSANVSFSANTSYHIKIVGNMTAKTYDVFITPSGGSQTQIANDYAFRSDAPATDDAGKVCLNSATTNSNDFKVQNHTVSTGSSTPVTFNPSADSYVRSGTYATTNYGTSTVLEVKYDSSSNYARRSYLKFSFSSLSASSASNAKLRVYLSATDGDASTIKVYGNSTESWTETGITWNNAPSASTYIASISAGTTAGQWYEVDVTSYVNSNMSDKLISLELINEGPFTDGNKATFSSRDASSNKPELVITP